MNKVRFNLLTALGISILTLCSTPVMADYAAAVLADGPIAYYSLDEVDGGAGTTATNQGTLGGVANGEFFGEEFESDAGPGLPGFGANNKAIRLTRLNEDGVETAFEDASGVSVDEPILDELTAFTLSGWINPTEHDLSQRAGIFGQDNAIEFGFIGASQIQMWAQLPGGGTQSNVTINVSYEDFENDEWHHIALTGDGESGDVIFYVDGVEQDFIDNNQAPLEDIEVDSYGVSGNPFYIGGGPIYGADRQYAGAIDEVAVFDKALTEEQVMAHYQAGITGGGGNNGDINGDGNIDATDIDALAAGIQAQSNEGQLDINGDGSVSAADHTALVKDVIGTWIGDANLDGEFNSSDFVAVFTAGLFETNQPAGWAQGDWNGDGVFGSGDFVAAFTDGGFEQGPPPAAVPEPATGIMVLVGTLGLMVARRRS